MTKQNFCLCINKGADQLYSNSYCTADQRLCFCYTDSTIPLELSSSSEISASYLQRLNRPFYVGHGQKLRRPVFSRRGSNYLKAAESLMPFYGPRGEILSAITEMVNMNGFSDIAFRNHYENTPMQYTEIF